MKLHLLAAVVGGPLLCAAGTHAEFLGVAASHGFVDIEGYGAARVVRLYACFTDPADRLLTVMGNEPHPMSISAGNTPFYQDETGGDANAPRTALYPFFCGLRYDTFVDIGRVAGDTGDDVITSPDFTIGATALATNGGLWGRTPDTGLGLAGTDGKVFFGQFTVPADAPLLAGVANFTVRIASEDSGHVNWAVPISEAGAVPIPLNVDVNGNQDVDVDDLIETIMSWGSCVGCPDGCDDCFCYADANEDGQIDGSDMFLVLARWGSL